MKKYLVLFLISVLGIVMFSCKDDPEPIDTPPTTQEALNAIAEYALVNKLFSDSFSEADDAAKYTDEQIDGTKNGTKEGPTITITPFDAVTWPKTVVVDYGETNYLCTDGRYRRGVINFETTGFYREEGTVITITFDEYYQNDYKVEGTQIVTNTGRNADENYVYTVEINDGKVTVPVTNKVINYEENTTREWAEGEPTVLDICDDVYYITGNQNGLSSDSIAYVLTVQQQLDVKVCCNWIRAGLLDVDIEGLSTMTIDYGDGTCDNDATVTYLGEEYPIEM
ncbi:MAG: hypothetical protein C0596_01105 [Marinilabiliales bacterium]|nr:MAG: hypothetical protein C0596_01105 [Marinilabiliales bacterium]